MCIGRNLVQKSPLLPEACWCVVIMGILQKAVGVEFVPNVLCIFSKCLLFHKKFGKLLYPHRGLCCCTPIFCESSSEWECPCALRGNSLRKLSWRVSGSVCLRHHAAFCQALASLGVSKCWRSSSGSVDSFFGAVGALSHGRWEDLLVTSKWCVILLKSL